MCAGFGSVGGWRKAIHGVDVFTVWQDGVTAQHLPGGPASALQRNWLMTSAGKGAVLRENLDFGGQEWVEHWDLQGWLAVERSVSTCVHS